MDRINQVYLAVYNSVAKEIEDNGKISITEESAENVKALELAHIIPIVSKQQPFLTWQPYDILGKRIFFDLF